MGRLRVRDSSLIVMPCGWFSINFSIRSVVVNPGVAWMILIVLKVESFVIDTLSGCPKIIRIVAYKCQSQTKKNSIVKPLAKSEIRHQ